jgi:hypothetical protein
VRVAREFVAFARDFFIGDLGRLPEIPRSPRRIRRGVGRPLRVLGADARTCLADLASFR